MTTNTEVSSNTVLMKAVDKTKLVVVIGLDDNNKLYIDSNRPTFDFLNYILNKAQFAVNWNEMSNDINKEMEAEQAVKDQVAQNVTADIVKEKKRTKKDK